MTFPQYAREQIENDPARWFEPYEKARGEGEWRPPEALMDRVYGRPKQAVDVNTGFDTASLEPGERAELKRVILEQLSIHARRTEPDEAWQGRAASPLNANGARGPSLAEPSNVLLLVCREGS